MPKKVDDNAQFDVLTPTLNLLTPDEVADQRQLLDGVIGLLDSAIRSPPQHQAATRGRPAPALSGPVVQRHPPPPRFAIPVRSQSADSDSEPSTPSTRSQGSTPVRSPTSAGSSDSDHLYSLDADLSKQEEEQ